MTRARCGSISAACDENWKLTPVVRSTSSPSSVSATGSSSIPVRSPAAEVESTGDIRGGLAGAIPPTAAESLKESDRIAVAGSLRLHAAEERLLVGGFRAEQCQIVDIACLHLAARQGVSHFRRVLGVNL